MMWVKKEEKLGDAAAAEVGSSVELANDASAAYITALPLDTYRDDKQLVMAFTIDVQSGARIQDHGSRFQRAANIFQAEGLRFIVSHYAYRIKWSLEVLLSNVEAILLGFQHYVVALGSIVLIPTILVPQMGGSDKEKATFFPRLIKSKRRLCDRYALLLSVPIVWIYAEILTWSGAFNKSKNVSCRTDSSGLISGASWLYIPFPFQWGPPTFRTGETFAAIVASFVASTESTGSFIAAARYGSATPVPPSVISRGVGWLGMGTLLNALFGSVTGAAATVENAGLLALTKAGSRRVVQISSAFMILFSILGKFGAIFASIPLPIMAASYCIFFGYVSSAGLGFLQFCNLNSFRTKLILGFSFFIGLSLPQYFREHHLNSRYGPVHTPAFNDIMSVIFMSHATVAAIIALVLDRCLDYGSNEARNDNGSYWWDKFMVYNKDGRTDEFYKLPGKLNRCFPSL
ncbi:hypothetical protein DH2020_003978 [Rehmannia glutinosa]|uniref:Nucleobase-ascorbate transporter-like protein n=1 Tax=Rehmannia glutinosa TaxID=99300 RepID=A0ABR0XN98_REHGL